MNLKDKVTMVISSCQAYSDLWDANILLLNQNWPDREIKTILLTDEPNEKTYQNVCVFSAGKEKEWSERIGASISIINTEYILLTLDDYFLTKKINTEKISRLVEIMQREDLSYMRLASRPWESKKFKSYQNLYEVNLNKNYAVNLCVGLWKKSFLEKAVQRPLNAWMFEVSLTEIARSENAKCAMSKGNEFPILDVIRKGKLLRNADRYFRKNPIYFGSRKVMKWKDEAFLEIRTITSFLLPRKIIDALKKFGKKHGMYFYSE